MIITDIITVSSYIHSDELGTGPSGIDFGSKFQGTIDTTTSFVRILTLQ